MVTNPKLPPRKGYVEDVDLDTGEHYYRPIQPPEKAIERVQEENKLLHAQLQAQSDRSDFIEDCIAEMAMQVYGEV